MSKEKKCPQCGSTEGVYAFITAVQSYDFDGEPVGELSLDAAEDEFTVCCSNCGAEIGEMSEGILTLFEEEE